MTLKTLWGTFLKQKTKSFMNNFLRLLYKLDRLFSRILPAVNKKEEAMFYIKEFVFKMFLFSHK